MSNSRNRSQGEIEFEVKSRIGILQTYSTGWTKELNIIAWNGGASKYDIRDWNPDHTSMSRGITLHEEEALKLKKLLDERFARTPIKGSGWDTAENAEAVEKERQEAVAEATLLFEEDEQCEEEKEEEKEENEEIEHAEEAEEA